MNFSMTTTLCIAVVCLIARVSNASPLIVTVSKPAPPQTGYFKTGTTRNPDGHDISVNSQCLLLDGKPWFPVMGEFHYSRVPQSEWRAELLKMKGGGVDIVSTYVFWIHHEEVQEQWDWTGCRDLHQFLQTCRDVGLKVIVRCGPWCHGEVRNGGFPDWVVAHKDWKLRSTDTNFLNVVTVLYQQIATQLHGELWKDGGPVIGIQVDNEFRGPPAYLLALKQMAMDAGIDVPLYTKTGWPAMRSPVPRGELLPLFGTYAEGFWDRSLTPMDGINWTHFVFSKLRTDSAIANDIFGNRDARDEPDTDKYPHLTCEIGGGMETSYHRRILVDPRDVESVVLTQLGDGSAMLGYYMYHGGQNPNGKLTTLQESQSTGYANDLPVKNYDFQAPIGKYGQINPQYHWLRRLHLFLHDFGSGLASMPISLPDLRPTNRNDLVTLRWAARSDGNSGYIFVNNYQRLQPMPEKHDVQFKVALPSGDLVVPSAPVTIPADTFFLWPFNMDLGGVRLIYATAQPICFIDDSDTRTVFFFKIPGIKADFAFDTHNLAGTYESSLLALHDVQPGHMAKTLRATSGRKLQIVLLDDTDSLALWKENWLGRDRAVISAATIINDRGQLKFNSHNSTDTIRVFPFISQHLDLEQQDGIFEAMVSRDSPARSATMPVNATPIRQAGPAREIPLGKSRIAIAPADNDFTNAAAWSIDLPPAARNSDALLRISYVGDVARLTLNGKLLDDNFYNGKPFEVGLKRYGTNIFSGDLRLEILPLKKEAPVMIEASVKPVFKNSDSIAEVKNMTIAPIY